MYILSVVLSIMFASIVLYTIDDRTWKNYVGGVIAFMFYAIIQSGIGEYKMADEIVTALITEKSVAITKDNKVYTLGIIAVNEKVEK